MAALLTPYTAIAVAVGWAHGARGLAALSFFYVWAAAWVVFALAWGWAGRAAGRWNVERLERPEPEPDEGPPPPDGDRVPAEPARVEPRARAVPAL